MTLGAGGLPELRQKITALESAGVQGPQGPAGSNGADGAQGIQGEVGPQGPAGADGSDGVDGQDGAQGLTGPAGADGQDGATGPKGDTGDTGPQGIQGLAGIDGNDGAQGIQGIQGPAGNDGVDGNDGAQGIQGLPGNDGADGQDGAQGIQGVAGNDGQDGADGAQGIQGIAGNDGVDGADGAQGPAGNDGAQGIQGIQGVQGDTGPQGEAGPEHRYWQQMPVGGRMYCYSDARWIACACDDNYSFAYYQWTENAGTGADPLEEWEHKGFYIREGTVCKELAFFGRVTDAATIADLEFYISFVHSNGRWDGAGLDNDGEDDHTLLYRGFWNDGPQTNLMNDDIRRAFPLTEDNLGGADFVAPADGNLRIYARPINVDPRPNTTTDYAQLSGSWLISYNDEDMA